MSMQATISEGISVEKTAEGTFRRSAADGSGGWHITLTISLDHDFPVSIRICDRLPDGVGPGSVVRPDNDDGETWEVDDGGVTYGTVVPANGSVTATYLLDADGVDDGALAGTTTIERVRPLEPTPGVPNTDPASLVAGGGVGAADAVTTPDGEADGARETSDADGSKPVGDRVDTGSSSESGERTGAASDRLVPRGSDVDPLVSFVMPTMNEEAGIRECIERATAALEALGVTGEIVVSDSSDDRTPEIAAELGAHVVTPDQEGYGYAYRYAFERTRGEYVVIGDADTTYDFEELPKLFERLQETGADMVMGSRLEGEIKPGAMPSLHQYVGNPLLTRFLNVFYEAGVSDAHSGFRIIRRDALDRLDLRSDGMEFASEMIMQAAERGLDIAEVPIVYHPREGEATLDSFRDGWRHVRFMLLNAPGYLFTGPAIGLGVVGVVMMALSLMNRPFAGVYFGQHTMIAGCLVAILGYQVGSLGLFSAVAAEPIRSPRDPVTGAILNRFRLEHGTTLGLILFTAGAVYTTYLIVRWVRSGYTELPIVPVNMLAFTVLVLGVQTVFYSFFLSLLARMGADER